MAKTLATKWYAEAKNFRGFFACQSRDRLSTTIFPHQALHWPSKKDVDYWIEHNGGSMKWTPTTL